MKGQRFSSLTRARPPYQQNDYVGWITRAKRPETQEKRLAQMLDELATGERYMNMPYQAKRLWGKSSSSQSRGRRLAPRR
jgi:hypothetical protein